MVGAHAPSASAVRRNGRGAARARAHLRFSGGRGAVSRTPDWRVSRAAETPVLVIALGTTPAALELRLGRRAQLCCAPVFRMRKREPSDRNRPANYTPGRTAQSIAPSVRADLRQRLPSTATMIRWPLCTQSGPPGKSGGAADGQRSTRRTLGLAGECATRLIDRHSVLDRILLPSLRLAVASLVAWR